MSQKKWNRYSQPTKKTAYAKITIYTGDIPEDDLDDSEWEIEDEYYVGESRLGEAIDNAVNVLQVYSDSIPDDHKSYKMPNGKLNISNLFMKKGSIPTKRTWSRQVATCAYNATDNYLKHWLGRQLDRDDKDWYSRHSLVTTDGLPQEFTFTVLQQLVEAYGCGIKGIQVPRTSRRFPEQNLFIKSLGANPLFMVNGNTTNEEAYEVLYPEAALPIFLEKEGLENTPSGRAALKRKVFDGWRFECVDMPDLGSVIMRQFTLSTVGHNGGSNYYGPRSNFSVNDETDKWLMAVQFAELKDIEYLAPIELEEYKEYEGTVIYDWWAIKCDAGKTLRGYAPKYKGYTPGTSGSGWGGRDYDANTAGSNMEKTQYFADPLGELGYDAAQILSMSWKTSRQLKDGKIKAEGILVNSDGTWEIVNNINDPSEGQMKLLTDKGGDFFEDKILAYPPLCEGCQKAPGDTVFDIEDNLMCENCGDAVESFLVPKSNLLSGWTAVSEQALSDLPNDDDEEWMYSFLFNDEEDDARDFGDGAKRSL